MNKNLIEEKNSHTLKRAHIHSHTPTDIHTDRGFKHNEIRYFKLLFWEKMTSILIINSRQTGKIQGGKFKKKKKKETDTSEEKERKQNKKARNRNESQNWETR